MNTNAPFSVLILTKNEEDDLPGCLQSLGDITDIVVYDSLSTDQTREIALSVGARLEQRPDFVGSIPFDGNEAYHRTWGIREIKYENPWLFVIDADERLTPEAFTELMCIASNPDPMIVAYRIRRRDYFQGRQLKYTQMSSWYIRFFRPEFVHYERRVNPLTVVNGAIANLRHPLNHYPFSKGVSHWLRRHDVYSDYESLEITKGSISDPGHLLLRAILTENAEKRRASLKVLYYKLPLRPLIKFLYIYLFRFGFLDGRPGLTYSLLIAFYELIIAVKVQEIKQK
jgi:glycosyltransferase involved in cell wall biosynthesis